MIQNYERKLYISNTILSFNDTFCSKTKITSRLIKNLILQCNSLKRTIEELSTWVIKMILF
jgi:hypothetical protein